MSITAAKGFSAAGGHCGIKQDDVFDVAVVVADQPAAAAAVFTTSLTAAPVIELGREHLEDPQLRAIVVASGCANAGTGQAGLEAVIRVADTAAELIGCQVDEVLVATTGSIGPTLPDHLVRRRLPDLISDLDSGADGAGAAAKGILTTDKVVKEAVVHGDGYLIGGMSKGSGMVRPNMATMLAYVTTDAVVDAATLHTVLTDAVEATFNGLNIDGCQSTNDMVAVLASGASGVAPDAATFREELTALCRDLVVQMAADAEGGTRVVTINLSGAADDDAARALGMAVADSALVRSSFYGGDPNWGRIFAALGVAGVGIRQDEVKISYCDMVVADGGIGVDHNEPELLSDMETGDLTIDISVGDGIGTTQIITTDLSPQYVAFNGERS